MSRAQAMIGALNSSERTEILRTESQVVYAEPGYLVFAREGTLLAQPFDAGRRRLTGDAMPVAEAVRYYLPGRVASTPFSVSKTGVLVYRATDPGVSSQLTWLDTAGKQLATVGPPGQYRNPRLSPDGTRIALEHVEGGQANNIWLFDLQRDLLSRFTFDPGRDLAPLWMPDSSHVVYLRAEANGRTIFQKPASGAGKEGLIGKLIPTAVIDDVAPDGSVVVYHDGSGVGTSLWTLSLSGRTPTPRAITDAAFARTQVRFSADGQWIAYVSVESGSSRSTSRWPRRSISSRFATGGRIAARSSRSRGRPAFTISNPMPRRSRKWNEAINRIWRTSGRCWCTV
jgi:Tol biopolymer transport system component